MLPTRLRTGSGATYGTSCATGLPRFVMTTGVRVVATSSSIFSQTSLNLPAAIRCMQRT